ncbi:MAG: pirin family protein [Acidimicrobiaceae bacterium]|nr:pirin family protein [Ilumatobacter sp.]MCB9381596.1 pirin family protein [Acidimicrobiaceae bacterium]MCO5331439.1 pirin family protein [Ilumatobacteraceae bacterium]
MAIDRHTDGDVVVQTVPLGFQWPTADPYLFCVHHLDHYPAGNGDFGPAASLAGRNIGSDFEPRDGWRMYHGSTVPGFPEHPHRGFETVTFARRGYIDHSDSLGAAARFGRGDVQWMTAGRGVVHSEMFPLLSPEGDGANTVELFQIWMNLPAADKMVEPYFTMLWAEQIPVHEHTDAAGRTATVTVIAGQFEGLTPPAPPPSSWASRPEADVAIWHVVLSPGGELALPPARGGDDTRRVLYVFEGSVSVDGTTAGTDTGVVVQGGVAAPLAAGPEGAEVLVLQGRPIGEPVAQYGPFVMNTRAEIEQAFTDYRRTGFGGWPWDRPDPVHRDAGAARFARHASGRVERPAALAQPAGEGGAAAAKSS